MPSITKLYLLEDGCIFKKRDSEVAQARGVLEFAAQLSPAEIFNAVADENLNRAGSVWYSLVAGPKDNKDIAWLSCLFLFVRTRTFLFWCLQSLYDTEVRSLTFRRGSEWFRSQPT